MDLQITHGTFTIEKRYPHAPEKVFDAFSDPVKKRRWMGGENDPHVSCSQASWRQL